MKPLRIVIAGDPRVKKNGQKVVYRASIGHNIKLNSKSYITWHTSALQQLDELGYDITFHKRRSQLKKLKQDTSHMVALINQPINLQCRFYMRTYGRVDLSALYEGIQDVLVECGILEDDNWHIVASHDGSGVWKDSDRPRMEITITEKVGV